VGSGGCASLGGGCPVPSDDSEFAELPERVSVMPVDAPRRYTTINATVCRLGPRR
jgi:hypothetical protein